MAHQVFLGAREYYHPLGASCDKLEYGATMIETETARLILADLKSEKSHIAAGIAFCRTPWFFSLERAKQFAVLLQEEAREFGELCDESVPFLGLSYSPKSLQLLDPEGRWLR